MNGSLEQVQAVTFGAAVRQAREGAVMTQEMLAIACDLNVRTIRRLEAGEKTSFETLRSIAAVLPLDIPKIYEEVARLHKHNGPGQLHRYLPKTSTIVLLTLMVAGFAGEVWQHSRIIATGLTVFMTQRNSEKDQALVNDVFALRLAIAALPGGDDQPVDAQELIRRKLVPPQILQMGRLVNSFAGDWQLGGTKATPKITVTVLPQHACGVLASLDIFSEIQVNGQPVVGRSPADVQASCASTSNTVSVTY